MKNIKMLLGGVLLVILTGCSESGNSHSINTATGKFGSNVTTSCINGVVYYSSLRQLAPAFNKDSTVKTCEEKNYED